MFSFLKWNRDVMHAFSSFIFSLHMVLMCGLESRIKLLLTSESAAIYHLQGSLDRVSLRDQISQFPSLMLAGARGRAALLMCHTDTGHQGAPWHVTVCQCSPLHLWCVSPTSNYDTGQVTRTKCIFWICCLQNIVKVFVNINRSSMPLRGRSLDSKEDRATPDTGPGTTWDWADSRALDYCREKDCHLNTVVNMRIWERVFNLNKKFLFVFEFEVLNLNLGQFLLSSILLEVRGLAGMPVSWGHAVTSQSGEMLWSAGIESEQWRICCPRPVQVSELVIF